MHLTGDGKIKARWKTAVGKKSRLVDEKVKIHSIYRRWEASSKEERKEAVERRSEKEDDLMTQC